MVIFSSDKTAPNSSPAPTCILDALRTRFTIDLAFYKDSLLLLFNNYIAFYIVTASLSLFSSTFTISLTVVAVSVR